MKKTFAFLMFMTMAWQILAAPPPLRVRESDSSPNVIPVYELVVSNGGLTNNGQGKVTLANAVTGNVAESDLLFTDITTANSSSTKHGLLPKLSNSASQYLDGTGAFSAPAGSGDVTAVGDCLSGACLDGSTSSAGSTITMVGYGNDGNTLLLLHGDDANAQVTFNDSSSYNATVTANGNVKIDTAQSKFGGSSILFDGTGDFLQVPDSSNWAYGTTSFTIDLWLRINTFTPANQTIYSQYTTNNNDSLSIYLASGSIAFEVLAAGADTVLFTVTNTFNTAQWYHIAFVKYGTAQNNMYVFIDGVSKTLSWNTNMPANYSFVNYTSVLTIGRYGPSTTQDLNGWIDEYRIYSGAVWTAGFTVATTEYYGGQIKANTSKIPSQIILPVPVTQTIAASDTIKADACGTVKKITAAGAVSTNATNTFMAPATGNNGCVMHVVNTSANNITLKNNTNFITNASKDIVLSQNSSVNVFSDGSNWYQDGGISGYGNSWTVTNVTNQACNTTCSTACLGGYDGGTSVFVNCASALADTCFCAS